jgi:membrane protease YdiL (CAAX protease family)
MDNNITYSKLISRKILIEIITVLATVFSVKWVAYYFQITGAGSIGVWSAILMTTLFMKQRNTRWYDLGLRLPKGKREWIVNLLLALLVVVASFLIISLVLYPLLPMFGFEKPSVAVDQFTFFLGKPLVFIGYLIGVVWFGAALGEELLMRGYFLSRIIDLVGNTKFGYFVALTIHAVIFGMLHAYQGVVGIITTAVVAIIFGLIYLVAKRRLFPLILAHGIIDTISLTAIYFSNGVVN